MEKRQWRVGSAVLLVLLCLSGWWVQSHQSEIEVDRSQQIVGVSEQDTASVAESAPAPLAQKALYASIDPKSLNETQTLDNLPHRIIYTVEADMVLEKLDSAKAELLQKIHSRGGYVSEMSVNGASGEPREGTWKVRIPVDQYEMFLVDLSDIGSVKKLNATSQEVGEEFYDTSARVKAKRIEEARLLIHLQRSTARLPDILAVERELSRVRSEIETMEGRLRYLTHQTAMATLTIQIHEAVSYIPAKEITFGSQVTQAGLASLRSLRDVGKGLTLTVVTLLPWLAVLSLLALSIRPFVRRWQRTLHSDTPA